MKKTLLLSLILASAAVTNAQTSDKNWSIGAGIGAYGTAGGSGFMPELHSSRYLTPLLDLTLKGNLGLFNSTLTSQLDISSLFLNMKFKLAGEDKKVQPYLFAGPGILSDNSESGVSFNAGLGSKYYLTESTALYLEGGYINGVDAIDAGQKVKDNFWKATVGIEFEFGKAKDSDMDGVSDKKDKCPETPAGVAVDVNGCPVDTDGDGIADYLDDCPTVAGLTSLKGCPDTDKDGIADKDDACPDVAGLVSLKGCPDSDGDGVTDKDDKCPNTKKGLAVDANGCPLDQDNDGVIDAEDECPTVAGPKNNMGCPPVKIVEKKKEITPEQVIIQKIKTDPVHFPSNQSYLTDYSKNILNKLIKTLNEDQAYHVNAFGFTDSQGSDELNITLSKDRVNSVAEYLISKGISKERILQQKALGKQKPVATNDTEEGRLRNRRVEFEIFKMK